MADPTITLLEYLRKVGVDLDGDFLQEGTRLLAQLAVELEAEQVTPFSKWGDRRRPVRAIGQPQDLPQRAPPADVGDPGGRDPAADPQASGGDLLSEPAGAQTVIGAGPAVGDPERVCARGQHPQGRRPTESTGPDWDRQEQGLSDPRTADPGQAARSSTKLLKPSATGRWRAAIPTSGWMPCT